MGLRAMLGLGLGLGVLAGLGKLLHQPLSLALVGVMMGMMASINVQDPHPRQQRITLLWAIPIAVVAVSLAAFSAPSLVLSSLVFLGVIFLSVSAQRFGPRGVGLGMIGFMLFFLSLFFHAPTAQLPWVITSVVVGGAVAYGVRFWIIPDRPDVSLRRAFAAFHRSLSLLLADLSSAFDIPDERQRVALLRHTSQRLNEAALKVEQQVEHAAPGGLTWGLQRAELREQLLELELTAERLLFAVHRSLEGGPLSAQERRAIKDRLELLRRELRAAGTSRSRARPPPGAHPKQGAAPALCSLYTALDELGQLVTQTPSSRAPASAGREETPLAREQAGQAEASSGAGLHPSTRQAIQATVAGGLALVAGHGLSSTRWYWAVIAAFVVFNRATTRGDILLRAWNRIFGTVIGVLAGLLLATVVSGHRDLELALIFVCVFLGFYLIQASYAWMVFWFTALLSVLYSLLGLYTPQILYLRVWETLIGAGIGATVAVLLLPTRTAGRVQGAAAGTLRSVASFLEDAAGLPGNEAVQRVREIDGKLRELRDAARPLMARLPLMDRPTLRLVHALSALIFFVRQLAPAGARLPAQEALLRRLELQLAENARTVASTLEGAAPRAPAALDESLESARAALASAQTGDRTGLAQLLHWLERIDAALLEVYANLGRLSAAR